MASSISSIASVQVSRRSVSGGFTSSPPLRMSEKTSSIEWQRCSIASKPIGSHPLRVCADRKISSMAVCWSSPLKGEVVHDVLMILRDSSTKTPVYLFVKHDPPQPGRRPRDPCVFQRNHPVDAILPGRPAIRRQDSPFRADHRVPPFFTQSPSPPSLPYPG